MTGLRPGTEVHGAGTVVGPGPDPGTSWAVPDDPAVAGVVVDHATHGHLPLTRDEQAARMARAELVLARGVVLAWHRLPEGSAYLDEYRVHLVRCAASSRPAPFGWSTTGCGPGSSAATSPSRRSAGRRSSGPSLASTVVPRLGARPVSGRERERRRPA